MKKFLLMVLLTYTLCNAHGDSCTMGDYTWQYNEIYLRYVGDSESLKEKWGFEIHCADIVSVSPAPSGKISIPNNINGLPVVRIKENLFRYNANITEVDIPSNIGLIESRAFGDCISLKSIVLPDTIAVVEKSAFENCGSLTNAILSAGMNELAYWTFENCISLETVILPDSIKTIEGGAFSGCRALKSVAVNANLVEGSAFCNCDSLRYLVLGPNVARVEDNAFYGCYHLWEIVKLSTNLRLTIGEGIAKYAKRIYDHIPEGWGDFRPLYYTVSFDSNGGEGEMQSQVMAFDEEVVLAQNEFTHTGYQFQGWTDGTAKYADCQIVRNLAAVADEDVVLYARWTPNKYKIMLSSMIYYNGYSGGYSSVKTYDVNYGDTFVLNNLFYNEGRVFKGWARTPDGEVEFKDGETVSNLSSEEGATVCLYAVWEGMQFPIYFDANDGEGYMEPQFVEYGKATALASNEFSRVGYKFAGWATYYYESYADYEDGAAFNLYYPKSTTLYAVWEPNSCTVKFDTQGGDILMDFTIFAYNAQNHVSYYSGSKSGYKLKGWALSPDGEVVLSNGGYDYDDVFADLLVKDGGEITLYAIWEGVECWLIFSLNGGSGTTPHFWLDPRYDEEITMPSNTFIRTGYSFLGWTVDWPFSDAQYQAGQKVVVSNLVAASYHYSGYITSYPHVWIYAVWKNEIETPVIEIDGGTYKNASCAISLSCETGGTTIYYTIDGSNPKTNGMAYSSSFTIWKTVTIKAAAKRSDGCWSEIAALSVKREDELGEAANFYGCTMETDESATWVVDAEESRDGVSSVRSGAIGNSESTWLLASVKKAGTISFWWRAKCEEADGTEAEDYYDYGAFSVDGEVVARIAGNDTGWQYVAHEIATGGKHTIRWEYRKDGSTSYSPDCIWLDCIQWVPADGSGNTLTTPGPMPYSWFARYNFASNLDYETLGNSPSGKTQGGISTTVWDEYVAGTDPTDENDKFAASITFGADGKPQIAYSPKFKDEAEAAKRKYTTYGKAKLTDAEWTPIAEGEEENYNFFKVTVEMR